MATTREGTATSCGDLCGTAEMSHLQYPPRSGTSRESSRERRTPLQLQRTWQASTLPVSRRLPRGLGNTKSWPEGAFCCRAVLTQCNQASRKGQHTGTRSTEGSNVAPAPCPGIDYGISRSRNLVQKVHFDPRDNSSGKSV